MNVALPAQDKPWAFALIFFLSLGISGGAALYFYRKKWF
jgi:Mg2+ and Co2+ transporter CorA